MAKKNQDFTYEYNPVKETVGGKQAEKVVWSTISLNKAIEAIKQGLPLKANPFCGKNTKLLRPDLVYRRTKEEIDDYIRCAEDPVYFASKCYLMTPTGLQQCVLRDYQEDYLKHIQNNRFSVFLSCRQSGKSTTTAIACLWKILFNVDKSGLILSKSCPAGQDLLKKLKDMYMYLPYYLKCGTYKWNQSEISFDNNSSISTESFSPTAGLGKTINFLILDEFAWCPPSDVELFYNNIIPTITADTTSNICIMSTQNGFNLFYKIYTAAVEGKNIYAPFKVDWYQVPMWDAATQSWKKRDEKWKQEMIGVLGSEEAFYYQYGTQFSVSDNCIVSRQAMEQIHKDERVFTALSPEDYENKSISLTLQYIDNLRWDPEFNLEELNNKRFIILADLAEGGGGDYTVFHIIEVIDKDTFKQIGYWLSNKVDLQHAALEYWLLVCQLFNNGNTLLSIEWNTYGALFYEYIKNYNESEYDQDSSWRLNIPKCIDGIDMDIIIKYLKESIENRALDTGKISSKYIPGIRFNSGNKHIACSLLKMDLESGKIIINDVTTINELENFEDKNGNGSYAAKNGHDDIIMTLCQIPMLKQTPKFKNFIEELETDVHKQQLYGNDTSIYIYSSYGFNINTQFYPSIHSNHI